MAASIRYHLLRAWPVIAAVLAAAVAGAFVWASDFAWFPAVVTVVTFAALGGAIASGPSSRMSQDPPRLAAVHWATALGVMCGVLWVADGLGLYGRGLTGSSVATGLLCGSMVFVARFVGSRHGVLLRRAARRRTRS